MRASRVMGSLGLLPLPPLAVAKRLGPRGEMIDRGGDARSACFAARRARHDLSDRGWLLLRAIGLEQARARGLQVALMAAIKPRWPMTFITRVRL